MPALLIGQLGEVAEQLASQSLAPCLRHSGNEVEMQQGAVLLRQARSSPASLPSTLTNCIQFGHNLVTSKKLVVTISVYLAS